MKLQDHYLFSDFISEHSYPHFILIGGHYSASQILEPFVKENNIKDFIFVKPYQSYKTFLGKDIINYSLLNEVANSLKNNFDRSIEDIKIVFHDKKPLKPEIHIKQEGQQSRPIELFGGGMNRTINILLALTNKRKKVVCVDDLGGGLHHSIIKKVWNDIMYYAIKNEVQFIANTHNRDLITDIAIDIQRGDKRYISEIELSNDSQPFYYMRVEKNADRKVNYNNYSATEGLFIKKLYAPEVLVAAIDANLEIF